MASGSGENSILLVIVTGYLRVFAYFDYMRL